MYGAALVEPLMYGAAVPVSTGAAFMNSDLVMTPSPLASIMLKVVPMFCV